jgi:hypothetical protein
VDISCMARAKLFILSWSSPDMFILAFAERWVVFLLNVSTVTDEEQSRSDAYLANLHKSVKVKYGGMERVHDDDANCHE